TEAALQVPYDGSAAHDENYHGDHHVKLADDPCLLEPRKRHAVRRPREPDHDHRHADQNDSVCDIHDRSPVYCSVQTWWGLRFDAGGSSASVIVLVGTSPT